ncbi:MAG: low specificity L-threonine aldolase [Eubacteriales bacterium]|nr:low specificity L-threonine aldolase [Eubacteriales bacterium]
MISFDSDYLEGAHPDLLKKILETNYEQTPGYGEDIYCHKARALIREKCGREDIDVHFLVGGTQANLTLIGAALRPHQGVISADTGHINVHETGAIEAGGHKILSVHSEDGKIRVRSIKELYDEHYNDPSREHSVQPGMVYISDTTELGTIYTRNELREISDYCKEKGMYLFLDGARLGYALKAEDNDVSLNDLTNFCDAFYIGGTKVGALFGEAMVISHPQLKKDFRYIMKQKGGLLAKGRLIGLQFTALFEDDLYFKIAGRANSIALEIRKACEEKGLNMLSDSKTNQQFPIIPDELLKSLSKHYSFSVWRKLPGGKTAVRFCISWATSEESVRELIRDIKS